ncbi:hypothetical protein [Geothermobacter hydrogeniphilus]|uniref:Uncharacterized protein n=1 Tax=Geothermobacter hydrogeniphilus TaxID=1969733 RepID=A0A1X0Y2A2_9BACT|nr:hypothetical protein [Geothermobacter hydrogeniphilus]ORJ59227.1 hypothetical protein B5V00_10015 [Geothermobacter hydrogeniphilus]
MRKIKGYMVLAAERAIPRAEQACPGDQIVYKSAGDPDIEDIAGNGLFDFGFEDAFDFQIGGTLENFFQLTLEGQEMVQVLRESAASMAIDITARVQFFTHGTAKRTYHLPCHRHC